MSYHGYINQVCNIASAFPMPAVLEIGIDKGQTLFPVVNNLTRVCAQQKKKFLYLGIDIELREHVKDACEVINRDLYGPLPDKPHGPERMVGLVELREGNSLDVMPKLVEANADAAFSVALIDGDHNYYTVSREIECAASLLAPQGIIICDDYDGPGGCQDEFFSETTEFFEGEKPPEGLVSREEVRKEKQGVKAAVDEFLANNKHWTSYKVFVDSEPIVLFRKDQIEFKTKALDEAPGLESYFVEWRFL